MPKFKVSYSEVLHYFSKEIVAKDEDEATEKYIKAVELNDIGVCNSETYSFEVEEIKYRETAHCKKCGREIIGDEDSLCGDCAGEC